MVSGARAKRVAGIIRIAPGVVFAGIVILPLLHISFRAGLQPKRVAALIDRRTAVRSRVEDPEADIAESRTVARAILLGARLWRLHGTSCLARSLLTWAILRRRGIRADVVVGMNRTASAAHAWVEVDGHAVDDSADVRDRYLTFDQPFASSSAS